MVVRVPMFGCKLAVCIDYRCLELKLFVDLNVNIVIYRGYISEKSSIVAALPESWGVTV